MELSREAEKLGLEIQWYWLFCSISYSCDLIMFEGAVALRFQLCAYFDKYVMLSRSFVYLTQGRKFRLGLG